MSRVHIATPEEIVEGLADAVGVAALDGRLLYVNAEFERSTGWPREEAIGRTALELGVLSEEEFNTIGVEILPRLIREGFARNIEGTGHRRDGSSMPILMSWALIRDPDGEPAGMLNVVRDISDKKRSEEALRTSEERWRSLVEDSPDYILTVDRSGQIEFINRTPPGIEVPQVIGTNVAAYVPESQRPIVDEALATAFEAGKPGSYEIEAKNLDGSSLWQSVRVGPIRDGEEIVGATVVATDVTARKRLERAREQFVERTIYGQDEERRRIARELHDGTGQSLAALMIGLQALELSVAEGPERDRCRALRDLLDETAEEVRRIARGLHPSILDDLGFVAAIRRHVEDYSNAYGIEVDLDFLGPAAGNALPRTVELALYRVTQEALTNIAKHSGAKWASLAVVQYESRVDVRIEDDGVGFEARDDQTPPHGTTVGLGLVGIRERIALLDGLVEIGPREGGGTRVRVRVPLHEEDG